MVDSLSVDVLNMGDDGASWFRGWETGGWEAEGRWSRTKSEYKAARSGRSLLGRSSRICPCGSGAERLPDAFFPGCILRLRLRLRLRLLMLELTLSPSSSSLL